MLICKFFQNHLSQKEYNEEELIKAINCLTKRYPDWISNPCINDFYINDFEKICKLATEKGLLIQSGYLLVRQLIAFINSSSLYSF